MGGVNRRSELAEQGPESLLLKVPIIREDFVQPPTPHSLHRNAIDQTIAFVWPGAVQVKTGNK
jgi:hypothetical protein